MRLNRQNIGIILLGLASTFAACNEESSDQIGDTPIYQRYKVEFSASGDVTAYAHFSKNSDKYFKDIKLEGEQGIKANGKEMDYNNLDNLDFLYNYSANLSKNTNKVTFAFTRQKGMVLTNTVAKSDVAALSLPATITLVNGSTISYTTDNDYSGGTVKAELSLSADNSSNSYNLTVDTVKHTIAITNIPAAKGYTLTLSRERTMPTTQNNSPAGGSITVIYKDERTGLTVK
jgi:hypothetical protein